MPRHMPGDWEEDEWHERDYHRTSGGYNHVRPYPRTSGDNLLSPEVIGSSMRRSRSHGQSPAPNVYVYTSQRNDVDRSPSPDPRGRRDTRTTEVLDRLDDIDRDIRRGASRSRAPEYRDTSPYYREMQLQLAREREDRIREEERLRDRLSDIDRNRGPEKGRDNDLLLAAERRLARLEDERYRELDQRNQHERDDELYKKKAELKRLKDRIAREEEESRLADRDKAWKAKLELEKLKDEEKRAKAELKAKEQRERILDERDKQEKEAKAERNRIKAEIERKEHEDEEERKDLLMKFQAEEAAKKQKQADLLMKFQAEEAAKKKKQDDAAKQAVAEYEQKRKDEKAKDEALREKFRLEDEARKRKEKEEEEEWKMKIAKKEQAEKDAKKKKEKELEEEMHKKLAVFGFQENQIEAVLKPKKAQNLPMGMTPHNPLHPPPHHHRPALDWRGETPTYIKVHKTHIDIETLKYFGLPWEYDTGDSNYIVILQEMDTTETELLFEHTRKLRRGGSQLLIEERGRKNEYAFVRRHRKPSVSPIRVTRERSKSRVRTFGLF
ncbi:hypothetical protein EJ08DRAFT_621542 [Tothia fuscella]|uniref:Uncharacterized protein n=1 Tax=Tothia fuscella TaxID=1048955 RepID=A0A9P4TT64_9PEZI|nr:hypothetical protein EJ08DRAFT_621542 [Tothia fuscella]